jgi:hypothetical protein
MVEENHKNDEEDTMKKLFFSIGNKKIKKREGNTKGKEFFLLWKVRPSGIVEPVTPHF